MTWVREVSSWDCVTYIRKTVRDNSPYVCVHIYMYTWHEFVRWVREIVWQVTYVRKLCKSVLHFRVWSCAMGARGEGGSPSKITTNYLELWWMATEYIQYIVNWKMFDIHVDDAYSYMNIHLYAIFIFMIYICRRKIATWCTCKCMDVGIHTSDRFRKHRVLS